MRPRTLNFEQLVQENKEELRENEQSLLEIELKLEKKRAIRKEEKQA